MAATFMLAPIRGESGVPSEAKRDGVDVHEDPLGAIARGEQVIEASRVPARILAAVAQEDPELAPPRMPF
jgi:hypothetical protein